MSDLLRVVICSAVALGGTYLLILLLSVAGVLPAMDEVTRALTWFVISWPVYTGMYLLWSYLAYRRLGPRALRDVSRTEADVERRWYSKFLGLTGTTNTTLAAAGVAVVVTVALAQQSHMRSNAIYLVLALLTVASSWMLMAFSFAQRYLRLSSSGSDNLRFRFDTPPTFGDHVTLALALSVMAAATPAEIVSRDAWRVARANMAVAFVFNSVIIAMMVSLLFGAITG